MTSHDDIENVHLSSCCCGCAEEYVILVNLFISTGYSNRFLKEIIEKDRSLKKVSDILGSLSASLHAIAADLSLHIVKKDCHINHFKVFDPKCPKWTSENPVAFIMEGNSLLVKAIEDFLKTLKLHKHHVERKLIKKSIKKSKLIELWDELEKLLFTKSVVGKTGVSENEVTEDAGGTSTQTERQLQQKIIEKPEHASNEVNVETADTRLMSSDDSSSTLYKETEDNDPNTMKQNAIAQSHDDLGKWAIISEPEQPSQSSKKESNNDGAKMVSETQVKKEAETPAERREEKSILKSEPGSTDVSEVKKEQEGSVDDRALTEERQTREIKLLNVPEITPGSNLDKTTGTPEIEPPSSEVVIEVDQEVSSSGNTAETAQKGYGLINMFSNNPPPLSSTKDAEDTDSDLASQKKQKPELIAKINDPDSDSDPPTSGIVARPIPQDENNVAPVIEDKPPPEDLTNIESATKGDEMEKLAVAGVVEPPDDYLDRNTEDQKDNSDSQNSQNQEPKSESDTDEEVVKMNSDNNNLNQFTVFLVSDRNTEGKDGFNVLSEAKTWLEEHGATVLMPMDVPDASWDGPDNDLYRKVDLVISVGEQGVFHYTSHAFDKLIKIIPPVLKLESCGQINDLESLDFHLRKKLNEYSQSENEEACRLTRMRLDLRLSTIGDLSIIRTAMNEVALVKTSAHKSGLRIEVNGVVLAEFYSDGVIISTPTGSNLYSRAAGGPLVSPGQECIIITPLVARDMPPMVVAANAQIVVTILDNSGRFYVEFDGRYIGKLTSESRLCVAAADFGLEEIVTSDFNEIEYLNAMLNDK